MADWDPGEHPRDKATGEFVERTSALAMLPQAEAWAFEQWYNSPDSPAISERPYRTLVPTRFQPGRRPT